MKLPELPDFDVPIEKKETKQTKEKNTKRKPKELRIPKTEYDDRGIPILAIPDLDDTDIKKELDRFFND